MKVKELEKYTDEDVITKIILGDIEIYEMIIRRYNPYLFKVGRSYGLSHHDTEDVMQEAYLNAYLNLAKFEKRSSFKTWLVKIMIHECYRKKHKSSYINEMSENNIPENAAPMFSSRGTDVIHTELKHVIEDALLQIPEDYRMVFSLRELSGMSTLETAIALNITETNVKVRLTRAKNMLRKQVESRYTPEDIFEFNLVYCDRVVAKVMSRLNQLNVI